MARDDDEERRLRSVALQNAQAILLARRQAEEALRKQSEWLRVTLASIGDAVISTDTEGRVTFLNGVAETLTGWPQAEAMGRPLPEVFHIIDERSRRLIADPALRALREGAAVGLANHTLLVARDGTERPVDDSAAPIRDDQGRVVGSVLAFRDIAERKRAEEQLRASEARLADELAAMTRLHDLIARLLVCPDLPSALEAVLDATVAILGADMGYVQLVDRPHNALEVVVQRGWPEDVLDAFRTVPLDAETAGGRAFRRRERVVVEDVLADAAYEPYRPIAAAAGYRAVLSTPLLARDGEPLGILTTFCRRPHRPSDRDQRILDLYTRQAADFLERARSDAALRRIAADLSEADRRKNEFLAMLAHELRNPLAPIRNALQIVRLSADDGAAVRSAAAMMERQVGHMVRLVDDLLDVSRVSRGKIDLRRERVDLAAVVRQAVETSRPAIERADHELTVALPPRPVVLHADPTRLAQVVGNLLNNAGKFTPRGGRISLAVEAAGGDEVVIRVRDTGIGIAAEQLPRVFDLFVQVDTSLERSVSGLGIGLTLVKTLVEMHGGTVTAHSAGVGRGTEFVVRLPVPADAAVPPAAEPAAGPPPGAARRILVVDDNRDAATSLALLLKLTGHETHVAHDGLEAVAAAEAVRPDVVLLDIGLPKLNGYEAARAIRERPWGKGMVLVALTGWGQEDDRRKSREAGFDGHMVKPVDHAELTKLLAELPTVVGADGSS